MMVGGPVSYVSITSEASSCQAEFLHYFNQLHSNFITTSYGIPVTTLFPNQPGSVLVDVLAQSITINMATPPEMST